MVDFVMLLIGRIASLPREMVLSNIISINDDDGGAIINRTIALCQKRNFKVED